ncbi:MAG: membrane protein insertase YidC [Planctomycetota bacterium]
MEKRIIVAGVLSLAIILIWESLQPKAPAPEKNEKSGTPSSVDGLSEPGASANGKPESVLNSNGKPVSGSVVPTTPDGFKGPQRLGDAVLRDQNAPALVLADEELRLEFDQKGAAVKTAWLLDHLQEVDSDPEGWEGRLKIIRSDTRAERGALLLRDESRMEGWLDRVVWDTAGPSADGTSIVFSLPVAESVVVYDDQGRERFEAVQYRLEKTISLTGDPNRIAVRIDMVHLAGRGAVSKTLFLSSSGGVFPDRIRGVSSSRAHSVAGTRDGDEVEIASFSAADILEEFGDAGKTVDRAYYVCDMGVYFGAYLRRLDGELQIAHIFAVEGVSEGGAVPAFENTWSELGLDLRTDASNPKSTVNFDWYLGAKDHRRIKSSYESDDKLRRDYLEVADFELTSQGFCCIGQAGPLGWIIEVISKFVVSMLSLFNGMIGNMGVSIIILTLLIRTLLFPITRKSQVAMQTHAAKMAKLKPKLDKLKEKHADDRQAFAAKQMELFKKEKVQLVPLGGCLPMFLQIPVFFGLFSALRFDYDLRHASFLWCKDLAAPDSVMSFDPIGLPCCIGPGVQIDGLNVFPLLMIAAMFFHQLGMPRSPDPQMQQQQKIMMLMPLVFGVMMYGYAAGLSVYWLSSSLFGIFEQRVIKKFFPLEKADKDDKESGVTT